MNEYQAINEAKSGARVIKSGSGDITGTKTPSISPKPPTHSPASVKKGGRVTGNTGNTQRTDGRKGC